MRRMVAGLTLLVAALPALAVNPSDSARSNPESRAQAQHLVQQLMPFIDYVEQNYFRPVTRAALLDAAVSGLYEAVREPLPAGLRNDLVRTKRPDELTNIVLAARERLGNAEAIQGQKGLLLCIQAVSRSLDPYCGIPGPGDRRAMAGEGYFGVGIELESDPVSPVLPNFGEVDVQMRNPYGSKRGPVRIVDVLPGGPAQRAGIQAGDLITHIDGHEMRGAEVPQLLHRLTTPSASGASRVNLTVRRAGRSEPVRVELMPTQFVPESVFGVGRRSDNTWNYMLSHKHRIGYIRLGFIDSGTPDEMRGALGDLLGAGVRGVILDLRACPGGYVDPAVELAGLFLKSKAVATVRANRRGEQRHTTGDSPMIENIPMVILVNNETRGGGEMLAAAFQDHKIAIVAGQRTFGKGSVQTNESIYPPGISYKLTSGLFFRPSGKNLHRFPESQSSDEWGVRPDPGLDLPITADLWKQVKEWQRQQALRPGNCRETLPLDDPENDPQRQFALHELLKKIK